MAKLDWERARQRLNHQPRSFGARWRKVEGEWMVETQQGRTPGSAVMVRSKGVSKRVKLGEAVRLTDQGILWRVTR
jgi:hypothetical protein